MASINFAQQVPIPPDGAMNSGLSPCGTANMLRLFGTPGPKSINCSAVTNPKLLKLLITKDVGPFNVTALKPAAESLARIFAKVQTQDPALYNAIKTAGVLCCRLIRGSKSTFSIHSFGCAIDLYCGTGVVPLGTPRTHLGVMRLYPYFHAEKWYWGAEFQRADAMHMETSRELIDEWVKRGWI